MGNKLRLHLDADASQKAVERELIRLGHDVTRTPNEWMPLDASDEQQLHGAMVQGRCILTYNIKDFQLLAKRYPNHAGIILAAQSRFTTAQLILALDRLLREADADEWRGQVRWLSDWK